MENTKRVLITDDPKIVGPDEVSTTGFRTAASGLLVPEGLERETEKFTVDEWNLIEKVARLAVQKNMIFRFFCMHPTCMTSSGPELVEIQNTEAGRVLRCKHKDRSLAEADAAITARIRRAVERRARRASR